MTTKNRGLGLTIKGLIVGALILLLLIPALIISNMVDERASRQREVAREVSSKWASRQTITGPMLLIPYITTSTEEVKEGKTVREVVKKEKKWCYVLPEQLAVDGKLEPQIRKRSIFAITVYQADVEISGSFAPIDFEELCISPKDLLPEEAQLCMGISDFRGVEEQLAITWDSLPHTLRTGVMSSSLFNADNQYYSDGYETRSYSADGETASGLSTPVALVPGQSHTFSMKLHLRGSEHFNITPVGKTTEMRIASTWPDPSFSGMFLPNEPAVITDKGFTASWKVMYLNRDYPQSWTDTTYDIRRSDFGVELLQPVDTYAKTQRSVKYAVLFIALTFVLYFLLEILKRRNVHPLQYVLVGLALCLFYTLLLAVGEYTGFNWGYLIASVATLSLITWYSYSVFKKLGIALLFAAELGMLYGFIFILLQLQDGALLFGSIGLFVLLAVIMYYSRKVDWQNENNEELPDARQ